MKLQRVCPSQAFNPASLLNFRSLCSAAFHLFLSSCGLAMVNQTVKNPPAMRETWVQSLDWEDSLEGGHGTPVFLPGKSPWTEEPGGPQSVGSQTVKHDCVAHMVASNSV